MSRCRAPLVLLVGLLAAITAAAAPSTIDVRVPDSVTVSGEDSYICITKPLPDKPLKLVGVEPIAHQEVVHHILLFGCDEPFVKPKGSEEAVWECKSQPTCGGRQDAVLYGWGRNADKLQLPKGVGFSVGKGSAVKWIVMQVHYLKEKPAGDNAGVRLSVQDTPVPYSAGMLSYASYFSIPPRKKEHYVLNHCCYRGFQPLTSFAVRVHTHTMGKKVFMARAPPSNSGPGDMVAIGDPQLPQGFYPTSAKTLWPGERLTVGCEFDSSNQTHVVMAGSDHVHEMCNMYLMVYSSVSHIEMCSDGTSMVDELAPGNMPHSAKLLRDPFPLWKPPKPEAKLDKGVVGNIASVTLGPDGTVWVLSRGGRVWGLNSFDAEEHITDSEPIQSNVVMQLHPDTGKILRQWGAGVFYMPHMITLDRNNTVWVTDVGRHQALQFSPSGQLLREVGVKLTPGHDHEHLCKPTQVAFLNDGSFLVADGYCNARVVRFNADGSYHSEYKTTGKGKGKGRKLPDMSVPHSLVVEECDNLLMVADREHKQVHTFDLDSGEVLDTRSFAGVGKVWALMRGPYGRTLALCWEEGKEARIVDIHRTNVFWALPDSAKLWPHDMALGAAAMPLTGAGDRMLAVYVAPLCEECGQLQKYVLVPRDFGAPSTEQSTSPMVLPAGQRPPLAHAGSGYHHHAHHQAPAKAAAAAAAPQQKQEEEQESEADKAADAQEQQAEEKVVQEEAEEDEQEVKQLHDPQVLQELKQQLAELQHKVAAISGDGSGSGSAPDNEAFAVFHTKPHGGRGQQGGVMGTWVGWVVAMLVGMAVATGVFVAYQKLSERQRQQVALGQAPVGNGVAYSQGSSDEEAEVVQLSDTTRLLRR